MPSYTTLSVADLVRLRQEDPAACAEHITALACVDLEGLAALIDAIVEALDDSCEAADVLNTSALNVLADARAPYMASVLAEYADMLVEIANRMLGTPAGNRLTFQINIPVLG